MFSWLSSAKPAVNETPSAAALTAPLEAQQSQMPRQGAVETPAPAPSPVAQPQQAKNPITSERSLRQLSLFFAGAGFLAWSTLVTRRAVARKQIAALPKFYHPSHRGPSPKPDNPEGSMIAVEALGLATLNVFSFGIMMIGGLSWAFDVSSVDDMRRMARRHIGGPEGKTDEQAEREVEEWVAKILSRSKEKKAGKEDHQGK